MKEIVIVVSIYFKCYPIWVNMIHNKGDNMNIREKAHKLVEISKQRGLIKNYCDWCETEEAK